MDPQPTAAPIKVVGRYAVYDEIASGGMATVHVGRLIGPVGFARTVAIKRLYPQLARDPEFAAMFLDEARVAARVRHPNVVPTLDVVAEGGELFLVMDYVHGESMSQLVRAASASGTRIPTPIVFAIVSGVLQGLHAAHEAKNEHGERLGIVHRDVSPQNVLVGTDGVARVLDFGVAKAIGRLHSTIGGQLKGKLGYMAPEQVRGAPVSPRTDVFSAGVVLWEALTGTRLFQGESAAQVLQQALDAEIAPPSRHAAGISPDLDALVLRALEREPERRFETARAMAVALAAAGQAASQIEVGEWVEQVARDRLARRAQRVADVESLSSIVEDAPTTVAVRPSTPISADEAPPPPTPSAPARDEPPPFAVVLAPAAPEPTAPPVPMASEGAPTSQVSSVNLTTIDEPPLRQPPSARLLVLAAAASIGAVIGVAGILWTATRSSSPAATEATSAVTAVAAGAPAATETAHQDAPGEPVTTAAATPPPPPEPPPKATAAEPAQPKPQAPRATPPKPALAPKPTKPPPTTPSKPVARPGSTSIYSPD